MTDLDSRPADAMNWLRALRPIESTDTGAKWEQSCSLGNDYIVVTTGADSFSGEPNVIDLTVGPFGTTISLTQRELVELARMALAAHDDVEERRQD